MSMVLDRRDIRSFVETSPEVASMDLPRVDSEFSTEPFPKSMSFDPDAEYVDFDLVFEIRSRRRRTKLPINATQRLRAGRDVLVVARTPEGLGEFRFLIDRMGLRPSTVHMSTDDLSGSDPETAWPLLDLLALAKAPNEFSLGLPGRPPTWNPIPLTDAPVDQTFATRVLQLRTVARRTGTRLRLPEAFSGSLSHSLSVATQLLAGAVVPGSWRSAEVTMPPGANFTATDDDMFRVDLHIPLDFAVGSANVVVDRWARLRRARFSSPRVTSDGLAFSLYPASDDRVDYRAGPWLSSEERQEMAAQVNEGDWVALLGDAILGSAATLLELKMALEESRLRPDKILRAVGSDLPGPK